MPPTNFQDLVSLVSSLISTTDPETTAALIGGALAIGLWICTRLGFTAAAFAGRGVLNLAGWSWRRLRGEPSTLARAILASLENDPPQIQNPGERILSTGKCDVYVDRHSSSDNLIKVQNATVCRLLTRRERKAIFRRARRLASLVEAQQAEGARELYAHIVLADDEAEKELAADGINAPPGWSPLLVRGTNGAPDVAGATNRKPDVADAASSLAKKHNRHCC